MVPVNQEESQGNNVLITAVKISEHIMAAEDPTATDHPQSSTHLGLLCPKHKPTGPAGWALRGCWFVCSD